MSTVLFVLKQNIWFSNLNISTKLKFILLTVVLKT